MEFYQVFDDELGIEPFAIDLDPVAWPTDFQAFANITNVTSVPETRDEPTA